MMRFAFALTLTLVLTEVSALKIGSFNIKAFGDAKMKNAAVVNILTQILPRYDIVLIMEVRDTDLSAVKLLMQKMNGLNTGAVYSSINSDLVGRDTYKERYLFIYRNDKVSVLDSYLYPDANIYSGVDTYSRDPFVVKFRSSFSAIEEFVLVPLHSVPTDSVKEVDALYDVYEDVIQKWGTDNIIFMGDFNADCSYITATKWVNIRLRTNDFFSWLIPDSADTTVATTNCAYDRIVVSGKTLKAAIVLGSAKPFNFQEGYNMTVTEALAVSDHYPVEVELASA
ncbi:deoxyribonuclease-1-like isoform X2 [Ascaphus truei]|uniref:deoxyribonuclease-1-like isoform X1 n=1 Tax=Ascaphus truei TaxID=8439 RepID=UPI003F5A4B55